ncbi:DUF3618 domain-containing protein [Truepera radiovictrix]|uniref:Uncharacterized protein n=1 Tax=Truepera radiovictrix (strain DSM 17093 / CIP 108686 / LMG 22925 / RQ-24) TaxID=649638 RepID=D7CV20_TRURR|nr:DUF3618 domain-containing protein [Truepera radiovictrix]ADI15847.1 conserved hypothetical protein [Truepera radiovictrix DSM 17093]WMT58527.1 DUF3618 domain-containing protein [Truepera radiovictrix]
MSRSAQDRSYERASIAELEADIARTRARISDELDAIGYRLSPAGLSRDASGLLGEAQDASSEALGALRESLVERGQRLGAQLADRLRRHPAEATLLGFGLAWLLMRSSRPRR